MCYHFGVDGGPTEEPSGVSGRHINTAVAHRRTEITVPIGAVDGVAAVKIHHVWYVGEIVITCAPTACH